MTTFAFSLRQRAWSAFLRHVGLPLGDVIWRQDLMKRLAFLEDAQWWPEQRVQEVRDGLLGTLLRTCYSEVPFYKSLFDAHGVHWSDIRTASDLSRLPVVTKAMLRADYPHRTSRETGHRTYEAHSSGSTGSNFLVTEDAETAARYRASFLLSLEWAGWTIGEPHLQNGITPVRSRQKRFKDFLLGCHYVSAYDLTDAGLDRALARIEKHSLQHLWGYPGSLYYLAQRAIQQGWKQPMKTVVTWGDNLYAHYRRTIEQAFQMRVFDTYGCSEGFQVAAQCGTGSNYHVHALDVIAEVVDDHGNPVAEGESGHVLITRLHPGPMPLVRYAVGDRCVRASTQACECGRGFNMIGSIEGRDTDVILTPSGNRLVVHCFTGVLEHFEQIQSFQVVQKKLDSIEIRIVLTQPHTMSRDLESIVISKLQQRGLTDMNINIEAVNEIPVAPSGKRRFVISEIAPRVQADSRAFLASQSR